MDEKQFFEQMLAECRQAFDNGQYPDAIRALLLCAWNEMPLPAWVAEEAEIAMRFYFQKGGGAPGRGKGGGYKKKLERDKKHRARHQAAEHELARRKLLVGGTREQAFERAHKRLIGTFAQGSWEQVQESWEKINAEYKKAAADHSAK